MRGRISYTDDGARGMSSTVEQRKRELHNEKFWNLYSLNVLDKDKITDQGWKTLYEYELDQGYKTLKDISPSDISKYNIDTSRYTPDVSTEVSQPIFEEPVIEEPIIEEPSSLMSKAGSFFKDLFPNETEPMQEDFTQLGGMKSNLNTLPIGDGIVPKFSKVETDIRKDQEDPLLMALNGMMDPDFIGQKTKEIVSGINSEVFKKQGEESISQDQFNPLFHRKSMDPKLQDITHAINTKAEQMPQGLDHGYPGHNRPFPSMEDLKDKPDTVIASLYGLTEPFIGSARRLQKEHAEQSLDQAEFTRREIEEGRLSEFKDQDRYKDMLKSTKQKIDSKTEVLEEWDENQFFNSFYGKRDTDLTKGEERAIKVGSFVGNVGKLILFSKALGKPTSSTVGNRAILGGVSGAESSFSDGGEAEDIVKEALIGAGAFSAGGYASEVVGNKMTQALVNTYKLNPQWGTQLNMVVRGAKGGAMGTVGATARLGLGEALGVDDDRTKEEKLKGVIQSGLIMGAFEMAMASIPWEQFTRTDEEIKDFNIRFHEINEAELQKGGYVKLDDLQRGTAYVDSGNPFVGDIYINPSSKDIVVRSTNLNGLLVPGSMVEGQRDTSTLDIREAIGRTGIRTSVDPKTQPDYIDRTSQPDKYERVFEKWLKNEGFKRTQAEDGEIKYGKFTEPIGGETTGQWNFSSEGEVIEKFEKDYFTHETREDIKMGDPKPRIQDVVIGMFDDSFTIDRNNVPEYNKQFAKDMSAKGYKEVKPGVWTLEEDGNIIDVVPEFTIGSGGQQIPAFKIKEEGKQDTDIKTGPKKTKGFLGQEYDIEETKPQENKFIGKKPKTFKDLIKNTTKEPELIEDKEYNDFIKTVKGIDNAYESLDKVEEQIFNTKETKETAQEEKDLGEARENLDDFTSQEEVENLMNEINTELTSKDIDISYIMERVRKFNDKYNEHFETVKAKESDPVVKPTVDEKADTRPNAKTESEKPGEATTEPTVESQDIKLGDTVSYEGNDYTIGQIYSDGKIFIRAKQQKGKSYKETENKIVNISELDKIEKTTATKEPVEVGSHKQTGYRDTEEEAKPTDIKLDQHDLKRIKDAGTGAYNRVIKTEPYKTDTGYVTKENIKTRARKERLEAEKVMKERILKEKQEEQIRSGPDTEKEEREEQIKTDSQRREEFIKKGLESKFKPQIVNDFANRDYERIINDFEKDRISKEEINQVVNLAEDYFNKQAFDFMKEQLADTIKPEEDRAKATGLEFKDESTGAGHGQVDMTLTALKDGKPIGKIDYAIYQGRPHINHIEVTEANRRRGVASQLMQNLQEQYPDKEIDWGSTTPDGTAFRKATTHTVENKELAPKFKQLEEYTKEFEEIDNRLQAGEISDEDGERWNHLHDQIDLLTKELRGKSPEKTMTTMPEKATEEKYPYVNALDVTDEDPMLTLNGHTLKAEDRVAYTTKKETKFGTAKHFHGKDNELVYIDFDNDDSLTTNISSVYKVVEEETPSVEVTDTGNDVISSNNLISLTMASGKEIDVEYRIVDGDKLIASHTISLHENKDYPKELQPRDRARESSIMQVDNIMNNLKPEWLGASEKISDGSPIIGEDYIVESGNGRVIALQKMYNINHKSKKAYQTWLNENKDRFGISKNQEMPDNPILVRVRKTDIDREEFVREANISDVSSFTVLEQAKIDSEKLDNFILNSFVANEEGKINTGANKTFIKRYMDKIIPKEEHGKYLDSKGKVSQDGISRIRNAIFYKAYNDDTILSKVAESLDNNIKTITNTMINIAPRIIKIKEGIDKGTLYDLDFSKDIVQAVNKYINLRETDITVEEFIKQLRMFDDTTDEAKVLLQVFDSNHRSHRKLMDYFGHVFNGIEEYGNPSQVSLFNNKEPGKLEILDYAERKVELSEKGIVEGQEGMFGKGRQGDSSEDVEVGLTERSEEEDREGQEGNLGYHAGDLGKAEGFFNMVSSNRGTGHFGTGTYFVGNKENLNLDSYKDRPLHEVDFTDYNLFKPESEAKASSLHNILRFANNYFNRLDYIDLAKKGEDIAEEYWELDYEIQDDTPNIAKSKIFQFIKHHNLDLDNNFKDILEDKDIKIDDLMGKMNEEFRNINRPFGRFSKAIEDEERFERELSFMTELSNVDIRKHMTEIKDQVEKDLGKNWFRNKNARTYDSPSTIFMKKLGYEGIDVRHIKSYDNTEFGSVIYDLEKSAKTTKTEATESTTRAEETSVDPIGIEEKVLSKEDIKNMVFETLDKDTRINRMIKGNKEKMVIENLLPGYIQSEIAKVYKKGKDGELDLEENAIMEMLNNEPMKEIVREYYNRVMEIPTEEVLEDVSEEVLEDVLEDVSEEAETVELYNLEIREGETKKGNPVWNVYGHTKPYKDILGKDGLKGYWYGPKRVWSFSKTKFARKEDLEKAIIEKIRESDEAVEVETVGEAEVHHRESQEIANAVKDKLRNKEKLTYVELFNISDKAFDGTMANNDYDVKQAYDGMELGVNQYLLEQTEIDFTTKDPEEAKENVKALEELLKLLPTQTKRTNEMEEYQQFSTPPNISYVAHYLANVTSNDEVLEPSAGIGGLAVFSKFSGAKVNVNELSELRLETLKNMPFDNFYNENAEQINNILPDDVRPTVVVMNPPFSATGGRMVRRKTMFATRHIEQAIERLEDNGRLVAIVGNTMGEEFPQFRDWWKDMKSKYNVLANVTIDGKNFRKYGTGYDINILVIDKTGPTTEDTITGRYEDLTNVIDELEGVRNDRQEIIRPDRQTKPRRSEQDSTRPITEDEGSSEHVRTSPSPIDIPIYDHDTTTTTQGEPISDPTGGIGSVAMEESELSDEDFDPRRGVAPGDISLEEEGRDGDQDGSELSTGRDNDDVRLEEFDEEEEIVKKEPKKKVKDKSKAENIDLVFSDYEPSKLDIKGAKEHPGPLVESTAMGAVLPPDITYKPNLPQDLIDKGELSAPQLEAITYAGQAHQEFLPDGTRKGFFIGDGTGVGKGREIGGVILDNMRRGHKKHIWITKNYKLLKDAQRDLADLGLSPDQMFTMPDLGETITQKEGILFVPYGTLRSNLKYSIHHHKNVNVDNYKPDKPARLDQIMDWLGDDFEGVIAFDEAHMMANTLPQQGARGVKPPTATGIVGQLLRNNTPKSKILYASATGATEVDNLGYLERLGLWGEETPFPTAIDFIEEIGKGGLASMELVARDMKSLGVYLARSLSYEGVTYDRLEHELTTNQREQYHVISNAWQIVMQNLNNALDVTGNKGGQALSQFWGSQQRFFNQVLTTMSMPSVLKNIQGDLDNGNSAVIQITNTGEATLKRSIARMEEQGIDLVDIDVSPMDILMQYLESAFPIHQFEDYEADRGTISTRLVIDSEGNPVVNRQALAMRNKLIAMVGSISMSESPLDMIINNFGKENVSEITGRSQRIERGIDPDTGLEVAELVSRTETLTEKEADDFADGRKRILIFSDAGGTGKSYHASNDYKNQQKRIHYVLQPGFSAMSAMQGLGRTHRTNQAQTPHVVLVTTDLAGHKRFTSTIARRLGQLGALTRGQSEAGTQGLFGEKDNLEGPTARLSLRIFYNMLGRNQLPGLDRDEVLKKMGLDETLIDEDTGEMKDKHDAYTDVPKFLNRILILDPELQNKVFNAYADILDVTVERAIEEGTLDVGLENFTAESVAINNESVLRTDETTGAETKYMSFNVKETIETVAFEDIDTETKAFAGFYQNTQSKMVRAYFISRSITDEDGKVEVTYRSREPELLKVHRVSETELSRETMKKVSNDKAKKLWNKQLSEVPEHKESEIHMITGAILPIWDKLPNNDSVRIMRVITDDNEEFLGRIVREEHLSTTLGRLGSDVEQKEIKTGDSLLKVMNQNYTIHFENGWRIEKRRVSGENRLELAGPGFNDLRTLEKMGIFTETIAYKTRFFIPLNKSREILDKIVKTYPIKNVIRKGGSQGYMPGKNKERPKVYREPQEEVLRSINDIMKDISKDFGVSISTKRFRGRRGERGQYQTHSESIRIKQENDINVIAHELGHHFDKKYKFSRIYENSLRGLAPELGLSDKYREDEIPGEVVAEFIRLYLTTENGAFELSEVFYDTFVESLSSEELDLLDKHKAEIVNWYASEDIKQAESTVISHTAKPGKVKFSTKKTKARMYMFDDLAPIDEFSQTIELMTGQKLEYRDNPYVLGLYTRLSDSIAQSNILHAQTDPTGEIIGKPLNSVYETINKNDRHAFDTYLKVKHAITLADHDKQVFHEHFSKDKLISMKEKYERTNPEFSEASEKLYEWWNRFIEAWLVETGLLSWDTWIDLQGRYPTYVPNFRALDENDTGGRYRQLAKKGFGNQHTPIKRMHGGAGDTYAVTESLVLYIDRIVKTQMRNAVGLAIHNIYKDNEGLGDVLTKVEHEIELNKFNAIGLKAMLQELLTIDYIDNLPPGQKRVAEQLMEEGGAEAVADYLIKLGIMGSEIIDQTIDDVITYFTPRMFSTDGSIFTVIDEENKTHFYEVHDRLFLEALLNMNHKELDGITRGIGKLKRVFTTLITGVNPVFSLISNLPGDIPETYTYGSHKSPVEFIKETIKSLMSVAKTELPFGKDDEMVVKYKSLGGGMGSYLSPNRKVMTEVLNKMYPEMKTKDIKALANYAMSLVEGFSDTMEMSSRFTEFKKILEEHGDTPEGRLRAIMESQEVTVNYRRWGSIQNTIIGQAVPYLNAGLQSINKFDQEFRRGRRYGKDDIAGDGGKKKDNKKRMSVLIKALISVTLFQLLEMIVFENDPDYQDLSTYLKDNYWHIHKKADGTFIKIRKPRQLGVIFGSAFRRAYYAVAEGEGLEAFDNFKQTFTRWFLPPNPFKDHLASGFVQVAKNESWRGTPIVGARMEWKPYEEQYDSSTSSVATGLSKLITQVVGKNKTKYQSPTNIEYLIQQYTGILGQIGLPLTKKNVTLKESLGRKLISDPVYSNDYTNDFYNTKDKLDTANRLYTNEGTITEAFDPVLRNRYNEVYKDLSEKWKEVNELKEDLSLSREAKKPIERKLREEIVDLARPENLEPTSYNEFRVLYQQAQNLNKEVREKFEETGERPTLTEDERQLLLLYNVPVEGKKSELSVINTSLNTINKRINQIAETDRLDKSKKDQVLSDLEKQRKTITDKYMDKIYEQDKLNIKDLF